MISSDAAAKPKVARKPTTPGLYQVSSMITSPGAGVSRRIAKSFITQV
jgi:hypothetical protein